MQKGQSMQKEQQFFKELSSTKDFIVALSTTVDTSNLEVRSAFVTYNDLPIRKVDDLAYLTGKAYELFHLKHLPKLKRYPHLKSVGYWEGKIQQNSWLLILPRELATEYVNNAREYLGQDSIIAFGPDCGIEIYDKPEDFCTQVGDKWVRFDFVGEVLETPSLDNVDGPEITTEATLKEVPKNYKVEDLVEIAYQVAPNIYYKRNWFNTTMDRDEFTQQAAMYIFDKFNEGYFEGKTSDQIIPMVIGMIQGWFIRNLHTTEVEKLRRNPSLNTPKTIEGDTEALDLIADNVGIRPDEFVSELDYKLGKRILDSVLKQLSDTPFASRKHTYVADKIKGLGKNVAASELVIAKLILQGKTTREISSYFGGAPIDGTTYYSHDSKASYISHKVRHVVKKLSDTINSLDDDEQEMVKDYISSLLD